MAPSIFLGLVTHDASPFPLARGPQGLLAETRNVLQDHGIVVQSGIHTANHFPELNLTISASEVRASIEAEISVEAAWHAYLKPDRNHLFTNFKLAAWRWYRVFNEVARNGNRQEPRGRVVIERLINIELAHLHLMEEAIKSESDWTLILEDDAMCPDSRTFATDLANFVIRYGDAPAPGYVNMSRSFNAEDLRIAHLLTPMSQWNSDVSILQSSRPVTNTVCAVLYQQDFLLELVAELASIPMRPVLPIDWKINLALMRMFASHSFTEYACWLLDPAPITQGSMHQ